jgi:hypothetical protein
MDRTTVSRVPRVGSAAWFVALRGDEENGRRLLCPSATPSATELLETAAAKIGGRMERGPVLTCSLGLSVDSLEVLVGQLELPCHEDRDDLGGAAEADDRAVDRWLTQRPGHCDRALASVLSGESSRAVDICVLPPRAVRLLLLVWPALHPPARLCALSLAAQELLLIRSSSYERATGRAAIGPAGAERVRPHHDGFVTVISFVTPATPSSLETSL